MPAPPASPSAPGSGRPNPARFAVALWAGWSLAVLLVSLIAARSKPAVVSPWPPEIARAAPPLARWDSGWYLSVARDGYSFNPTHDQNNVGFYPLFPLAARKLAALIRVPIFPAGIAISLAGVLAALVLLSLSGPPASPDALIALTIFPASFFLAAFYAEGLYLALSVAVFFLARRRLWILAGIAAAAACFDRLNGVTLLPALAWLVLEARREDQGRDDAVRAAALGIAAFGAAAFPVYLWRKFGDPLLYFHDKFRGWPTLKPGRFWRPFLLFLHQAHVFLRHPDAGGKLPYVAEVGAFGLLVWTVIWCVRNRRTAEFLYSGSLLLLLLFAGTIDGMHRYVAATFPCFLAAGDLLSRSRRARAAWIVAGAGAGVLMLIHFVRWRYVG